MNRFIVGRRAEQSEYKKPVVPTDLRQKKGIPDLTKRQIENKDKAQKNYFTNVLQISRPPKTRLLTVATTPTLILSPPHEWPYILSNPSLSIGESSTTTLHASGAETTAGNTQASPMSVTDYPSMHLFLDVTAVTGVWDFYTQVLDPVSAKWFDVQIAYSDINTTGSYYSNIGSLGVVTDFAMRWVPTSAGSITFSLGATVKGGTRKAAGGLARTIYLGGRDVSAVNGLPLFEGQDKTIYLGPEMELYAVGGISTNLKLFTL